MEDKTMYGRKGGTSKTAGRKAETIHAHGFKKRVFFGQRWLTVQQRDETDETIVRAWGSKAEADAALARDQGLCEWLVEYVTKAEPLANG